MMELSKKEIIIVLGVQRSGTSAITKALSVLDTDLGNSFIDKHDIVNSTGFWEDSDIYDLNKNILRYLGIEWSSLRDVNIDDFSNNELDNFATQAFDILSSKIKSDTPFVLKEPRITKLLPFWFYVFDKYNFSCKYVISLRKPNDVISSFSRLNGVMVSELESTPDYVSLLWVSYLLMTLDVIENEKYIIVNYDDLLTNPKEVIFTISEKLDIPYDNNKLDVFCEEFLNKNLNHSTKMNYQISISDELYTALNKIKNIEYDLSVEKTIEMIRTEYNEYRKLFLLIDNFKDKVNIKNSKVENLEKELYLMNAHNYKIQNSNYELENKISKNDKLIVDLNNKLDELRNLLSSKDDLIIKLLKR